MAVQAPFDVVFLNNDGTGFADKVTVNPGTTVGDFFKQRLPGANPNDYAIRVTRNNQRFIVASGELLQAGDKVSCLPSKIQGA